MLDWTDPTAKVSNHFTVKECIWLPSWNRMANENDGLDDTIKTNLETLCQAMDIVRDFLGKPINVHVTYRPEEYNKQIGGATHSAHVLGLAMDFDCGEDCNETRAKLLPMLEQWNMRMENHNGPWVHLDCNPVPEGGHRFFIP